MKAENWVLPTDELTAFLAGRSLKALRRRLDELASEMGRDELVVTFCGIFCSGKSTLINLLLDQPFKLPTGPRPTTRQVTRIEFGEAFEARWDSDGAVQMDEAQARQAIRGELSAPEGCETLHIRLPAPLLKNGVVLLDTPGFQGDADLEDATWRALEAADLAVVCCDATAFGKVFEQTLLERLDAMPGNYLLVVNFMDRLNTTEDVAVTQAYARRLNAGRGAAALSEARVENVFFTTAKYGMVSLGGLDECLGELCSERDSAARCAILTCARGIMGLRELAGCAEEADVQIAFGRDSLDTARRAEADAYSARIEAYNGYLIDLENRLVKTRQQGLELLEQAMSAVGEAMEDLERRGDWEAFSKRAKGVLAQRFHTVPELFELWSENEGVLPKYAAFERDFAAILNSYRVPEPVAKAKKPWKLFGQALKTRIKNPTSTLVMESSNLIEYSGYAKAAREDMRQTLAPKLRRAIEDFLLAVAKAQTPNEPEADHGSSEPIRARLREWEVLRDEIKAQRRTLSGVLEGMK